MSRSIEDLSTETRIKAREVQRITEEAGYPILIYCTHRSSDEQARLYRQSRTRGEVNAKIESLRGRSMTNLADAIERVGPQEGVTGNHVTMAGPGESWHQYRCAFDAVPIISGKLAWSIGAEDDDNYPRVQAAWDTYGLACEYAGLQWAGHWTRFKEMPHAQSEQAGNPLKVLPLEQINAI